MHHPNPIRPAILAEPQLFLRNGFLVFLALGVGLFALSQTAQAQLPSPAPDGGYPGNNTAEGDGALLNLSTGTGNTAVGFEALFSNTTGSQNTAAGENALLNNTEGGANTAIGDAALASNAGGGGNTAIGMGALQSNTNGNFNTATGFNALLNNNANDDTATGTNALFSNTTGNGNTASGTNALKANTTGSHNTATGQSALLSNTIALDNTGNGFQALISNTTGNGNTASGSNALKQSTTGNNNTATGLQALLHNTSGSNNITMGFNAGFNLTTGSNNIDIGNTGAAGESSKIRIGTNPAQRATFIAGISGVTVASGVGVIINTSGQLGTVVSSARFKDGIKPMDKASEAILALKPVTFRYKHELDPDGVPQFGLVAEEVEKVNPDLVVRGEDGNVMTVRYEAVNAMLLNEFLKEHRMVQELEMSTAQQQEHFESALAKQETIIEKQQKQIEALTATVKKVSDRVALGKPAPQLVANP